MSGRYFSAEEKLFAGLSARAAGGGCCWGLWPPRPSQGADAALCTPSFVPPWAWHIHPRSEAPCCFQCDSEDSNRFPLEFLPALHPRQAQRAGVPVILSYLVTSVLEKMRSWGPTLKNPRDSHFQGKAWLLNTLIHRPPSPSVALAPPASLEDTQAAYSSRSTGEHEAFRAETGKPGRPPRAATSLPPGSLCLGSWADLKREWVGSPEKLRTKDDTRVHVYSVWLLKGIE